MERKETIYNQIIGIKDGNLVLLNYIFDNGNDFKGATGAYFEVLSQDEAERLTDDFDGDELWRMAVAAGDTTLGLDDWTAEYIYACKLDGLDFPMQDNSYLNELSRALNDLSEENLEDLHFYYENCGLSYEDYIFNCVGGGRCFDANDKWDVVFRPDLLEKIMAVEK